jgi:hypothetical protein
MAVALPEGKQSFTTATGAPGVGYKLHTHVPGTSTPKATYTTSAASVANTNPVIADARGEMSVYWDGAYDVTLKDASDATIWGPERLETPEPAGIRADLANTSDATKGDALIGWGAITTIVDGELTRYSTLAAAVSGLGSTAADIVVRDSITVSDDLTVPSTAGVVVDNAAVVTVASGKVLTFSGPFKCQPRMAFDGAGVPILNGAPEYKAEWFGVTGDGDGIGGGTDNSAALAKALSAITQSGRNGILRLLPGRKYRCDEGLAGDVSVHTLIGQKTTIDYANLDAADFGLTLNADEDLVGGGSFYAAPNFIQGIIFKGLQGAGSTSPPAVTRNGLLIAGGTSTVVTGYEIRNSVFQNFTEAIQAKTDANAQAITWRKCNLLWNTRNLYLPLAVSGAAGSMFSYEDCFWNGGVTGLDIQNPQVHVIVKGGNLEGMTENYIYHLAGTLELHGLHLETGTDAAAYVIRQQSGQAGYASVLSTLSVHGCQITVKGTRTVPAFDFSKACSITFAGGSIDTENATHSGISIFKSDAAGEGSGSLTIVGTRLQKVSADVIGTFPGTGIYSGITVNDQWGRVAAVGATDYTGVNAGSPTVTPTSLTVTGSPQYSLTFTRFMDRVHFTLRITANGGTTASTAGTTYFEGLPYDPFENSAASCVTTTGVDQGSALVSTASAGRIFPPTWAADGLDRVITGSYKV